MFLDYLRAAVSISVVDADDPVVSQLGPLPSSHSTTPPTTNDCPVASVSMDSGAGNGWSVEEYRVSQRTVTRLMQRLWGNDVFQHRRQRDRCKDVVQWWSNRDSSSGSEGQQHWEWSMVQRVCRPKCAKQTPVAGCVPNALLHS